MNKYLIENKPSECCGCSACASVCPKGCIKLNPNKEGFLYPVKDNSQCIECGMCAKVCPYSDTYNSHTENNPQIYAAYDVENRIGSSSGGIFYTLAKYVIEKCHGHIFGAAFDDDFQLKHIGVDNLVDLQKLRGSKYLQSEIGDTYIKIKKLLARDIYVLFVGTPCQVAGLRAFLRKEYDHLLTADLVCHGVPSQILFNKHVAFLEKENKSKLVSYSFRDPNGWGGCEIAKFANSKHIKLPSYYLSPYLYSFMYSYTYRESCYGCKFSKIPRQGDITLADYWGAEDLFPDLNTSRGVSLVLCNTKKGLDLFNKVRGICVVVESNISDASKFNGNLVSKNKRPNIREDIYEEIETKGYDYIAKTKFRIPHYRFQYIKYHMLQYRYFKILYTRLIKIIRK